MDASNKLNRALCLGKKMQIKWLLIFPIPVLLIASLFVLMLSNGNSVFYIALIIMLIVYYLVVYKAIQNIANMMLLLYLLFLSTSILLIISCAYLIIVHISPNISHIAMINVLHPWNYLIGFTLTLLYIIYFIRKYMEIDVGYLKNFLKKEGKYNLIDKTYSLDKTKGVIYRVYKKKTINESEKQKLSLIGKINARFLPWLLLIAYYFIPISPFALRGVGHGEPMSYIMLMSGLFLAWAFGMGAQRTFALFRVYRQIEKEIGGSLHPVCT